MIDIGVANPRAQGQAMMSTDTAATTAYPKAGAGAKIDHRTLLFSSAEEFLGSPLRKEADLLISDIGLLGISGLELVRALHGENGRTPIILITAQTEEHPRVEAARLGVSHFHRKPFDVKGLLSSVEDLLGLKPQPDEVY
jgi:FixJ family two-component response regulator